MKRRKRKSEVRKKKKAKNQIPILTTITIATIIQTIATTIQTIAILVILKAAEISLFIFV